MGSIGTMWGRIELNNETAAAFRARLDRLAPDTPRQWGTMSSTAMVAHMRHTFDMSLGVVPVRDQSNFFTRWFIYPLAFRFLAPPRNIKAPAEFFPTDLAEFDTELQALHERIAKFLAALRDTPERIAINPIFGPRTFREWAALHGKHFDHHLRQFGV